MDRIVMIFGDKNCVELKECLACGSNNLKLTLDLHEQPLANSYKKNKDDKQKKFPLAINHCKDCFHVQLTHAVDPDLMFKDYLYVSGTSKTMDEHFKWFSRYAIEYYNTMNNFSAPRNILDIGCNDGSQLNHFKDLNVVTHGVDPAENLYEISSKNHDMYCGYFDEKYVDAIPNSYDMIIAQNVFAHNFDPLTFLRNARQIMNGSSLLFIQTSQADMIVNNEFDTIYHEHVSFYNINSMNELCNRAGLHLIDVIKCPLHGNSYIFVVSPVASRKANIENLIEMERKAGLLNEETYEKYALKCESIVGDLIFALNGAEEDGYILVGYGAAAKGMTLLNYADIHLDYIIDDNPLKQNRYTPGMSIPIVSCDVLSEFHEKNKIIFIPLAWNFFDEIKSKIKTRRNNNNDLFLKYFPDVGFVE
jgi:SAM-dependent methyltransferase